jgi:hypothetical protein
MEYTQKSIFWIGMEREDWCKYVHWVHWPHRCSRSSWMLIQICELSYVESSSDVPHPFGSGDLSSPSAVAAVCRIFAFLLARASLFINVGTLSFCLFRLISFLPLVRKGHEIQACSFLPAPFFFFFWEWTTSNFLLSFFIFHRVIKIDLLTIQQFCCPG